MSKPFWVLKHGEHSFCLDISKVTGEKIESIGVFPGIPDYYPGGGPIHIVRNLKIHFGNVRGKPIANAETFDEAEWVAHGLAKIIAIDMTKKEGVKLVDSTQYANMNNPYQDKVDLYSDKIRFVE